jgi:L-arabinokinase
VIPAPGLAYYVTAHGYGHGVRSCAILNALKRLRPGLRPVVVSNLPEAFFKSRLEFSPDLRAGAFDIGMVQLDSIRVDLEGTRERVTALHAQEADLFAAECEFLRTRKIGCVVSDIPATPLKSARAAGIPGIAVGNFGWDWIYDGFAETDLRWKPLAAAYRQGYEAAHLLLRLPFCEEMSAFRNVQDIPLVASPGRQRREEIERLFGCSPARKWILLSFVSLDWDRRALQNVLRLENYEFFTVRPLAWEGTRIHALDRQVIPFSDLLASVDGVVSKPGFGILSECIVNRKPLVYADRSDFREYAVLEDAIRRHLRHEHIPAACLYRGELGAALGNLWTRPEPAEPVAQGGAEVAARRILGFAGL